jgi:hypothetical protein
VANGTYYLSVTNTSVLGVVTSTTQQITVNRPLYQTTILVFNEAGEVVKHLYTAEANTENENIVGAQLSSAVIDPGPSSPGLTGELTITLSNGTTVVWDGTNENGSYVQNGQYFIEINATNGNAGETTITKEVTVSSRLTTTGLGTVTAWPNLINGTNGSWVTQFHSNSAMALTLKVSIYTVAGELIKVVEGPDGTNEANWDASGMASGVYIALVELSNPNGGFMGRQTLRLVVIH